MITLMWIKRWMYAILGSVLAVLGMTSVYYKGKAKKNKEKADTLKATVHAERVRKRIEKKERRVLEENEIKTKEKIKDDKTADNLTNSNDW